MFTEYAAESFTACARASDSNGSRTYGWSSCARAAPAQRRPVTRSESGASFNSPEDAALDQSGYLYIVDRLNRRVTRHDAGGNYVQTINIDTNSDNLPLLDPVTVGVDDSLAYVGDRGRGQVIRFLRIK